MNFDVGGMGQLSLSIVSPSMTSNIYLMASPVLAMCNYYFVIFLYAHYRQDFWFHLFPQK